MGNLVFQATLGGQVNLVGPNTASTYNINVPTVSGDMVTTGDTGTVTNTMLAGSIANAKLVNSSFTIGSTAVSLGETKTTVAGLTLTTATLTNPTINGFTGDTSVVNIGSGQFYKDTSGNVGIGTSSPTSLLHVYGGAGTNIGVQSSAGRSWKLGDGVGSTDGYFVIYDYSAAAKRLELDTNGNLKFNSGYGSVATAYGCRAWVNFNGTGTPSIRASGNVTSITDNGTGNYTVNFTNAMPDANYSAVATVMDSNDSTSSLACFYSSAFSTSSLVVRTFTDAGGTVDCPVVCVTIIR
jgi:hypothetical protein